MTEYMGKPYLIDSVIGNGRILACLTANGELVRAFWPTIDYAQHVHKTEAAVRVPGQSEHIYRLSSEEFTHSHRYLDDTNIVETTYEHAHLPFAVASYDFVTPDADVIVRHYRVINRSEEAVEVDFLYFTEFHMEENALYNSVLYDRDASAIAHFKRAYWAMVGGQDAPFGFQVTGVQHHLHQRRFNGGDVSLGADAAQVWTATVAAGAEAHFPVYLAFGESRQAASAVLAEARAAGADSLRKQAEATAAAFLARGKQIQTGDARLDTMYRRSLLVFSLMADAVHGGLIAAPEFDPHWTRCGGYGYCWGRDAGYITTAIDKAGYTDIGRKFYEWAIKAQDPDGAWDHRHYMNGELAPSWGYQADEPASILWGMWQHFLITKDEAFLKVCWTAMEKGADHLLTTLDGEQRFPCPSMDLWEERYAQHTYSSAAVAAALLAVADAAEHLGDGKAAGYRAAGQKILGEVAGLYNEEKQSWYRGVNLRVSAEQHERLKAEGKQVSVEQDEHGYDRYVAAYDPIVDVSLLGISYPFELIDANDEKVVATAKAVRESCWQPGVGGIRRYEDDHYVGGNPWVLGTLWLALDANRRGDNETVQEMLEWVLKHQCATGLLPEQVDKENGGPVWVVPLTWSHAMYVLTILEHFGA